MAGRGIPQAHAAVIAGGGNQRSIRAARDADDGAGRGGQGEHLLAGGGIPNPCNPILTGGG